MKYTQSAGMYIGGTGSGMLGEIDRNLKPREMDFFLCMPDKTNMGKLTEAYSKTYNPKLGALNEISFSLPYKVWNQHKAQYIDNKHIDQLKDRYLIKATLKKKDTTSTEYFRIYSIEDDAGDNGTIKKVHCFSLGIELKDKLIDDIDEKGKNAKEALTLALTNTNWSIDYVDSEFLLRYRDFKLSNKTKLDFVLQIAKTFHAVIDWDTENRKISLLREESVGHNKGLKIGYGKYMKSLGKQANGNKITTYLIPEGSDGLGIESANPNGSNGLEDLSFFLYPFQRDSNGNVIQSSYYMSDSLCNAILDYYDAIDNSRDQFNSLADSRDYFNQELTTKQSELETLQDDLNDIQDQLDKAKANGSDTTTLRQQKADKQSQIDSKQAEIDDVQTNLQNNSLNMGIIRSNLALENNFTADQLEERNNFIIEKVIKFDGVTDANELIKEAKEQFPNLNKPKTIIKMDIVDFLQVVESQRDWDKLVLGDIVTIEYERIGVNVQAKIIEFHIDYEEKSIELTIADTKEIKTNKQRILESLYDAKTTSATVEKSRLTWDGYEDNLGEINTIINNDWDAAKRRILAGVDNSVEISGRGIIIKDPDYPNQMLVAQAGVLALSQDGGTTWKTALTPKHIVGETIEGKILAGVNLEISNTSGTFTVDKDGVTISGADLTITGGLSTDKLSGKLKDNQISSATKWNGAVFKSTNYNGVVINTTNGITVTRGDNLVKTILNATDGIKIQGRPNTSTGYTDQFYVDTNGNAVFKGNMTAGSIDSSTITSKDGNGTTITLDNGVINVDGRDSSQHQETEISQGYITATQYDAVGDMITNKTYVYGDRFKVVNGSLTTRVGELYENKLHFDNTFDQSSSSYLGADVTWYPGSTSRLIITVDKLDIATFNPDSLDVNGTITCTTLNQTSDRKMKENIHLYDKSVLNKINDTNVYLYNFKSDKGKQKHLGFMYDEAPSEVHGIDKTVDIYSSVAYLWKGEQELIEENREMRKENKGLKDRVSNLEDRLSVLEATFDKIS